MKVLYLLIFLTISLIGLSSQEEKEVKLRDQILEAESYFYYEEYSDALPLYLKIKKNQPDNYNILYKIGVCYLNIPYEKDNAILYLEKAIQNTSATYKTDNVNETKAPLEAWFYLGNAYRINNRFDDASKMYSKFKELTSNKIYNTELVDQQIEAVETYYSLSRRPVYFDTENLGERINSKFAEYNAVVTPAEDIIIYNQKQQFYDALLFSVKMNGKWLPPINIIPELGVDGDIYATSISSDGTELFLYRSDEFDGNIYVSRYQRGKWSRIKRLNEYINTKYWESHASISNDGKILYFTSNRKGGLGGLDIYKATRTTGDNWENVQNLGNTINTKYNEESPFIAEDGKTIYFSSYGHYNMGGYDIFYSTLLDETTWAAPLNIGYPLNSADDDLFFQPVKNGQFAYLSRYYPGNEGRSDIYKFEIYSGQHPRKFKIKLFAGFKDLPQIPSEVKVRIINKTTRDTIVILNVDPTKAKAEYKLFAGSYQVVFEGKDFAKKIENIDLVNDQINSDIQISTQLQPIPKEIPIVAPVAEKVTKSEVATIQFAKTFIKSFGVGIVPIPLMIAPGTLLVVSVFKDGILLGTENLVVDKQNYVYNLDAASEGVYKVKFDATLPDKSLQKGEVTVVVYPEVIAETNSISAQQNHLIKDYIENLKLHATGSLLKVLNELDPDKEAITSIDELIMYLKSKGQLYGYDPLDVDKLINACNQHLAIGAKQLYDALNEVGDTQVKQMLNGNVSLVSPSALIGSLIVLSAGNAAVQAALLMALAQLADPGSLFYALKALSTYGNSNIKDYLTSFDPSKHNITNASQLYGYLFDSQNQLIDQESLINTFNFLYAPLAATPAMLVALLTNNSSDEQFIKALKGLDLNKYNFENTSQLQYFLFDNASKLNISRSLLADAILRSRHGEAFNEVTVNFNKNSSVNLQSFLSKIDLEKNKIANIPDFALFLNDNKIAGVYETDELIRLMAISSNIQLTDFYNQKMKENPRRGFQWKQPIVYAGGLFLFAILILVFFLIRKKKKK